MKAAILGGGLVARISEKTNLEFRLDIISDIDEILENFVKGKL